MRYGSVFVWLVSVFAPGVLLLPASAASEAIFDRPAAPAKSPAVVLAQAGSTGGTIGNTGRSVAGEEPRRRHSATKKHKPKVAVRSTAPYRAAAQPAATPAGPPGPPNAPYRCRVDLGYGRYEECK